MRTNANLQRSLVLCTLATFAVAIFVYAFGPGEADAQRRRRVPPPPRWVTDNTLWPAQFVPYIDMANDASMTIECSPHPVDNPQLLRCTGTVRAMERHNMAAPYVAMLESDRPGQLERDLRREHQRQCGDTAPRLPRVSPSWSAARQAGARAYIRHTRRLRELLCHDCNGITCRDIVEAIVRDLDTVHMCAMDIHAVQFDLTPTGAMRWGTETQDDICGGYLQHSFVARGRNWVYSRTRRFDEGQTAPATAPASCTSGPQSAPVSMQTGLPDYTDFSGCAAVRF